jgi:hypothetical protein
LGEKHRVLERSSLVGLELSGCGGVLMGCVEEAESSEYETDSEEEEEKPKPVFKAPKPPGSEEVCFSSYSSESATAIRSLSPPSRVNTRQSRSQRRRRNLLSGRRLCPSEFGDGWGRAPGLMAALEKRGIRSFVLTRRRRTLRMRSKERRRPSPRESWTAKSWRERLFAENWQRVSLRL